MLHSLMHGTSSMAPLALIDIWDVNLTAWFVFFSELSLLGCGQEWPITSPSFTPQARLESALEFISLLPRSLPLSLVWCLRASN